MDTFTPVEEIPAATLEEIPKFLDSPEIPSKNKAASKELLATKMSIASILNTGVILAVKAELRAVGGNEYALAINNEGEIRANGIEMGEDGTVSLVAKRGGIENSGILVAQDANGDGGSIRIQAENGIISNTGTLDVSSSGGHSNQVQHVHPLFFSNLTTICSDRLDATLYAKA